MKTRIRYTKQADGKLLSKEFFPTTKHNNVKVLLDPSKLSFEVVTLESNEVVASGSANDLAMLKKAAKESLKQLGIVFATESRDVQKRLKSVGIEYETRASL
jgi:hypothetical protein